jgi:hypothetical protein
MDIQKIKDAVAKHGSIRAAGRELGMAESTIRYQLKSDLRVLITGTTAGALDSGFVPKWSHNRLPAPAVYRPLDRTRYFILTSAQDTTAIHHGFWNCLNTYADWLEDCEILVSGFTYSKKLFEEHDKRAANVFFHPEIDDHIVHKQCMIGDELVFCGEMNTLPTAVKPLSGFGTYTQGRSGIFPHVKVQLESIATLKGRPAKQVMTTGAVTMPNYIRKKAGIKAEFDHIIGAVIVALTPSGATYWRHISTDMDGDGSFYDLDCHITPQGVTEGHRLAGITYADVHHEKLDSDVAAATWGYDPVTRRLIDDPVQTPLTEFLRPEFEFYHDLSDFSARNHHNVKDHHFILDTHLNGTDDVEDALLGCGAFLKATHRDDCISVVVQSNHDNALVTWLKTIGERVKFDPTNYLFYLKTETAYVEYQYAGNRKPPVFEDVLRRGGAPSDTLFVDEDSSFMVKGIECAMHGHLGANGAKASPLAFERMGSKSNTGHVHSPGITSGNYRSGVCAMEMGYNKGLSSWAITHTLIYQDGKRALVTFNDGRFYE